MKLAKQTRNTARAALMSICLLATSSSWGATIIVDTLEGSGTGGDGLCSIVEALLSANLNFALDGCAAGDAASEDIIRFDFGLFPADQTYTITLNGNLNIRHHGPVLFMTVGF